MRRVLFFVVPAILAAVAYPSSGLARSFAFGFDYYDFGGARVQEVKPPKADVDSLSARLYYTGNEWELVVQYKVETKRAPVGYCELALDLTDRDHITPPLRVTIPLERPTKYKKDKLTYAGQTSIRLANEHVRDPKRLRLYGYAVVVGGGPMLDRKSTSVRVGK
jgi:hypothetical protein